MTVNAGSIQYTVDVDTAQVINSSNNVNKSLGSLQTGFSKTDKAAAGTTKSMGTLEKSMGTAGGEASKLGTSLTPLAAAIAGIVSVQALINLQKLSEQFTLLETRVKRLSANAADAKTNYAALIKISSAGGSDLTTTIKLWESLTASLVSLGVTRDQVLSLTDTLQKIGKIGGSSVEEISGALRQFSQSVSGGSLRAEEFNAIIEQMPELGRKIADGLGIPFNELRQQMLDGKLTIDRVLQAIQGQTEKVNAEFKNIPRSVGDASNAIVNSMGVAISKIDQATGASKALAGALDAVAKGIRLSAGDLDQQQKLAVAMQKRVDIQTKLADPLTGSATRKAAEKELSLLNDQIKAIQDRKVAEQKAEGDKLKIKEPDKKIATDSEKALENLQKEAELIRLVGVERAKLQATQKLGPGATGSEIEQAKKLAVEIYNLENARKQEGATNKKEKTEAGQLAKRAAAEEKRGIEQNIEVYTKLGAELAAVGQNARDVEMQRVELSLNEFATPEQIAQVRAMAGALYDLNQNKSNDALLGQIDPAVGAKQGLDQQLKDLETLKQARKLSDQDYLTFKEQAETEYNARMMEIETQRFAAQSAGNQAIIDGLDALGQAGTQAFAGLLSGTMSLQDALGNIANTVLNAVIGSFVQAGVEWVKQQIVMASVGQATAAAATAASVGEAAIVSAAWAPAAAFASLASFGANAAPAAAALTSTSALASGLAMVSGKALGGPVQANGMYRVNETGAPEIFNAANGRQYMMPNSRGDVVSNKDATSGGSTGAAPVVNVNNYGNDKATASAKFSEADRKWVVDVIVGDMMGDGRTGRATNQLTGTRRQGT